MPHGAHAPKALHRFIDSGYPKECRVAKHCSSVSSFCQSALISWLVPQLPSAELPILETRRPPELIFIPIMEQVPPGGADLYGAPDAPATIAEALKQRMEKYQARKLIILATENNGEIPG